MTTVRRKPFGQRLYESRLDAGYLRQEEVAALVGMSQSTLSDLENQGQRSGYTAQLAALYGVNPRWLATGKGDKRLNTPETSVVTSESTPAGYIAPHHSEVLAALATIERVKPAKASLFRAQLLSAAAEILVAEEERRESPPLPKVKRTKAA